MRMRIVFKVVGSIFLAAHAFTPSATSAAEPVAKPPEVATTNHDALRDIWHGCLARAIREVDDHISPASDIATGVQSQCQAEYDALTNSFKFSPDVVQRINEDRYVRTRELATKLVLQVRAADRKK